MSDCLNIPCDIVLHTCITSSSSVSGHSVAPPVTACGCQVPSVLYATITDNTALGGCLGIFGDHCLNGVTFTLFYNSGTNQWEAPGDITFTACTGAPAHVIQKPIVYCDAFTQRFVLDGGPAYPSPSGICPGTYCGFNGLQQNYTEVHQCDPFQIQFLIAAELPECCCSGHIDITITG